jgi:hypothetical protein
MEVLHGRTANTGAFGKLLSPIGCSAPCFREPAQTKLNYAHRSVQFNAAENAFWAVVYARSQFPNDEPSVSTRQQYASAPWKFSSQEFCFGELYGLLKTFPSCVTSSRTDMPGQEKAISANFDPTSSFAGLVVHSGTAGGRTGSGGAGVGVGMGVGVGVVRSGAVAGVGVVCVGGLTSSLSLGA